MKTKALLIIISMSVSMLFGMGACSKNSNGPDSPSNVNFLNVSSDGSTFLVQSKMGSVLTENLSFSDEEIQILLHMKEEEKLARDVYTVLYDKWNSQIFSNISRAEETHLNAVIFLLQNYGEDYTGIGDPGVFSDPGFQALYEQLVSKGTASVGAAMETGALIEEMDIKDLSDYLEAVTNENVKLVFENLQRGSRNHLRAFNRQLTNLVITYVPVYISQEEFDLIVNSPNETGNGYRVNNQNKGGRQYRGGR
jgi:hypothetical protein